MRDEGVVDCEDVERGMATVHWTLARRGGVIRR